MKSGAPIASHCANHLPSHVFPQTLGDFKRSISSPIGCTSCVDMYFKTDSTRGLQFEADDEPLVLGNSNVMGPFWCLIFPPGLNGVA